MQLKKKTYFDFYENDKRTDTPQDLSTSKTTSGSSGSGGSSGEPPAAKVPKLESDGDIEMADATENESASAFDVNQQSNSNETATVRPQIIVSPRKSSAFAKMLKSENVSVNEAAGGSGSGESSSFAALAQQSESNSSASNTSSASDVAGGQSASGSPSKSVIVRVGSSASLVSGIFLPLFSIKRVVDTVLIEKTDIQFALTTQKRPNIKVALYDDLKMI